MNLLADRRSRITGHRSPPPALRFQLSAFSFLLSAFPCGLKVQGSRFKVPSVLPPPLRRGQTEDRHPSPALSRPAAQAAREARLGEGWGDAARCLDFGLQRRSSRPAWPPRLVASLPPRPKPLTFPVFFPAFLAVALLAIRYLPALHATPCRSLGLLPAPLSGFGGHHGGGPLGGLPGRVLGRTEARFFARYAAILSRFAAQ